MIMYKTIVESLIQSELLNSNLYTSRDGARDYANVTAEAHKRIVSLVNRAVVSLSTRFMLQKLEVYLHGIQQGEVIDLSKYSAKVTQFPEIGLPSTEDTNLIELVKLEYKKANKDTYEEVIVNNNNGFSTLSFNSLKVDIKLDIEDLFKATLWVMPKLIGMGIEEGVTEDTRLDVSPVYLNAIVYYVAMGIYSPTLTNIDATTRVMDVSYAQKYENECQMLTARGVDVDEADPADNFSKRGFI